jgi:hypothetical protein
MLEKYSEPCTQAAQTINEINKAKNEKLSREKIKISKAGMSRVGKLHCGLHKRSHLVQRYVI